MSHEDDAPDAVPEPGDLSLADIARVRAQFGVGAEQVRRDHLISHMLAALSTLNLDRFVFIGGTALSRTHLPDLRLSEDIDLIALGPRKPLAADIEAVLTDALSRILGRPAFDPAMAETRGAHSSVMSVDGIAVKVQLLDGTGYPNWPTEVVTLQQRYRDAPPARMRVLTGPAFAAAKLTAWADRAASRDLYDMWALTRAGYINDDAQALFARLGPFGSAGGVSFHAVPSESAWQRDLGHQCIPHVSAAEAATAVKEAWAV